jgi:multidrug efflux pump subunit AcrB
VNPADSPILILAVQSKTLPLTEVNDYADNILAQQISQIAGVGWSTSAVSRSRRCACRSTRPSSPRSA